MKRVLIVFGILLAAAAIVGLGVWLKGGTDKTGPNSGGSVPAGTLPLPAANGGADAGSRANGDAAGDLPAGASPSGTPSGAGLTLVSQSAVLDYAVNASGTLLLATPAGAVIEASSTEAVAVQASFSGVGGAWFSPNGRWLLVKSGDAGAPRWSLLDVPRKTWKDLTVNTAEMAWSPTGNLLAYFARRTNGNTLTVFDPQRNTTRAVLPLAAPDLAFRWQTAVRLFVLDRPSALVPGNVWDVNAANGSIAVFAANAAGADIRWGGSRGQGLLFKAGARGGSLSLVDGSGAASAGLAFLTLPSKCVFGDVATATSSNILGDYLLCAIPQDNAAMRSRQLPDDYLKRNFGTNDAWYAVNTLNGALRVIVPPSKTFAFDAADPKIYDDTLYFTNRNDQKLYRISLAGLIGTSF